MHGVGLAPRGRLVHGDKGDVGLASIGTMSRCWLGLQGQSLTSVLCVATENRSLCSLRSSPESILVLQTRRLPPSPARHHSTRGGTRVPRAPGQPSCEPAARFLPGVSPCPSASVGPVPGADLSFPSFRAYAQHPDGDPQPWGESRISALAFLPLSLNNSLGFTFHGSAVLSKKPPAPSVPSCHLPATSLTQLQTIKSKSLVQTSFGKVRTALKTRPWHLGGALRHCHLGLLLLMT